MADNAHLYGFRWSVSANGCPTPYVQRMHVATAQDDQDDNGVSIPIRVGDAVKKVNTGGVIIALTGEAVYGIVMGIERYYDAATGLMRSGNEYPNQTAWGTVEARRGYVLVAPVEQGIWELDVDDNTTATTEATYRALVGENADVDVEGVVATGYADPMVDISTHNTTNTLIWRIVDISPTKHNRDFSGAYVKVLLRCNVTQHAEAAASGNAVAGV